MKKALLICTLLSFGPNLAASQFTFADKPVKLAGKWQFHWQKFLPPESQITTRGEMVTVPSAWAKYKSSENKRYGFATYTTTLQIKNPQEQELIFDLPEIGEAYHLFINGRKVATMGRPASRQENQASRIVPQQVSYHANVTTRALHIMLHVSNFHQRRGGLWQAPTIGKAEDLSTTKQIRLYVEALIIGSFIFMALYHFALFYGYRHETSTLYFAIFVLILAIRSLLTGERLLPWGLDLEDHLILYRLEYILTYGSTLVFILFFQNIFARVLKKKYLWPLISTYAVLLVIVIFSPMRFFTHTLLVFQLSLAVVILWFLWLNVQAILKRVAGAKSMLIGLLLLAATVVFDIMLTQGLAATIKLTPLGLLAFTFAQAFILKNHFSSALTQVHELSQELQDTNEMYAHFVPHQFISTLNRDSIVDIELRDNVKKQMTVLFCDIRGFTTLSESMSPEETFKFINSYLSRISPVIEKHGGFIDKFIGDAIMALFPDEPDRAIAAAIEMQQALLEYNKHRENQGYDPIAAGIGLHTGDLMLGIIGNQDRWSSTVISDAVNLAARIESLTKKLGAKVATSAETFYQQTDPGDTVYRFLGRIKVKGKKERIPVFEILNAYPENERPYYLTSKVYFERGINLLSEGKIKGAADDFNKVMLMNPNDKVAQFYFAACEKRLAKMI